jgi:uncharacterized protein (TIGR02246 family)
MKQLMTKATMFVTVFALLSVAESGWAAEIEPADPEGLQALAEAYEKAMEARDAKAIAALYASDADIVDPTGEVFKGRAAIEAMHVRAFSPEMNLELSDPEVRVLTPDVVLVDGKWTVTVGSGETTTGFFTMIAARRDGKWAVHCTRAMAPLE